MNIAAVIGLALAVSPAASQRAAKLAHRSVIEYNAGDFPRALRDITAAYELDPRPGLLYNLGQCHRAMGDAAKALFFYRGYLREQPDARNRASVLTIIKELEAKLAPAAPAPPPSAAPAAPPVIVEAPPPPSPFSTPTEVPSGAVSEGGPPPGHSHWLGATLATAAVVCAGFAIVGAVRVAEYAAIPTPASNWPQYGQALAVHDNAVNWETAAIVLGVAAVGGTTGAILTW